MTRKSAAIRFAENIVRAPNGCWLWTGQKQARGYGQIKVLGEWVLTHRFAFMLHRGPIPEGKFVCHVCDVRECVCPDHLFLSNHQGNMDDKVAKGRQYGGERHHRAKITRVQAIAIRSDKGSETAIARKYGLDPSTIGRIRRGEIWKDLPASEAEPSGQSR